ncbi:MAG: DUF1349 domain-containing protein [Chloroflexi bacterium]|nr:DUF1349 domain-containing protein [Chloroflexota bacterium]
MPAQLTWQNSPREWNITAESGLVITAGHKTDWFIDPNGSFNIGNAPNALFVPPAGDFLLSAKITVGFASTFDAGVLRIHERDDVWAKLCFEYSPQSIPTVVSVVTRGSSDDCNSSEIDGSAVSLRIARLGDAFAFHYSMDDTYWHLVRYFTLGTLNSLQIGFSSQSPAGQGCTTTFTGISFRSATLTNLRNGE